VSFGADPGTTHTVVVTTDPVKHQLGVTMDGTNALSRTLLGGGPVAIAATPAPSTGGPPVVTVVNTTADSPEPALCESLIH
jgi:hypothetical protein